MVVDGTKALDKISLAELQVRRLGCLVHLKRNATEEERGVKHHLLCRER